MINPHAAVRSFALSLAGLQLSATRRALTILEVLVAIAILAILIAMLAPAVQAARERSRAIQCASNLRQLGVAIHSYHSDHSYLPPGNVRSFSLHVALLPYLGYGTLFNAANYSMLQDRPENRTLRTTQMELFLCPSDDVGSQPSQIENGRTNYAGNAGTGTLEKNFDGLFYFLLPTRRGGGPVAMSDVTDGLSNTAALSEVLAGNGTKDPSRTLWNTPRFWPKPEQFRTACLEAAALATDDHFPWWRGRPWTEGNLGITMYHHILEPNGPSCVNRGLPESGAFTATSLHATGVHVLFADGRAKSISPSISHAVWIALGSRSGAEAESY